MGGVKASTAIAVSGSTPFSTSSSLRYRATLTPVSPANTSGRCGEPLADQQAAVQSACHDRV